MQGIKAWAQANPGKLTELLNQNASYVFFRELPADSCGPARRAGRAADARGAASRWIRATCRSGAPVYIATTWPLTSRSRSIS